MAPIEPRVSLVQCEQSLQVSLDGRSFHGHWVRDIGEAITSVMECPQTKLVPRFEPIERMAHVLRFAQCASASSATPSVSCQSPRNRFPPRTLDGRGGSVCGPYCLGVCCTALQPTPRCLQQAMQLRYLAADSNSNGAIYLKRRNGWSSVVEAKTVRRRMRRIEVQIRLETRVWQYAAPSSLCGPPSSKSSTHGYTREATSACTPKQPSRQPSNRLVS